MKLIAMLREAGNRTIIELLRHINLRSYSNAEAAGPTAAGHPYVRVNVGGATVRARQGTPGGLDELPKTVLGTAKIGWSRQERAVA